MTDQDLKNKYQLVADFTCRPAVPPRQRFIVSASSLQQAVPVFCLVKIAHYQLRSLKAPMPSYRRRKEKRRQFPAPKVPMHSPAVWGSRRPPGGICLIFLQLRLSHFSQFMAVMLQSCNRIPQCRSLSDRKVWIEHSQECGFVGHSELVLSFLESASSNASRQTGHREFFARSGMWILEAGRIR
jgi:hypothetical protein